jgi:hypothetical protein
MPICAVYNRRTSNRATFERVNHETQDHVSGDDIRRMSSVACKVEGETTRIRHDVFEVARSTDSVSMSDCSAMQREFIQIEG